jgi:hypothetical protein
MGTHPRISGGARDLLKLHRCVGPQQVAQLELRPSVNQTGARNGKNQIAFGVAAQRDTSRHGSIPRVLRLARELASITPNLNATAAIWIY